MLSSHNNLTDNCQHHQPPKKKKKYYHNRWAQNVLRPKSKVTNSYRTLVGGNWQANYTSRSYCIYIEKQKQKPNYHRYFLGAKEQLEQWKFSLSEWLYLYETICFVLLLFWPTLNRA